MMEKLPETDLPSWVPEGAGRYLHHTEAGRSIRDLARGAGCHPSTVMRQIRRVENRRDDPLVDAALRRLAAAHFRSRAQGREGPEPAEALRLLDRDAAPVLRRLSAAGAVLAVAEAMDRAVVVPGTGAESKLAVEKPLAQALALMEWITCAAPGKISRYHITAAGRAAYGQMLADAENRARREAEGFAEAQAPFQAWPSGSRRPRRMRRSRYSLGDSPLVALSRRRNKDGSLFLDPGLVRAGERLREDFELAQIGEQAGRNWDRFLAGVGGQERLDAKTSGAPAARDRVKRALNALGPGLSDVALRCCCYLEGLETAEQKMGWSARSAKIVLRIALLQLKEHYSTHPAADSLIG
jgi:hypothetical protein